MHAMPPASLDSGQLQEEAPTVGERSLERYVACESWNDIILLSILQPWSSLCADSPVLEEF